VFTLRSAPALSLALSVLSTNLLLASNTILSFRSNNARSRSSRVDAKAAPARVAVAVAVFGEEEEAGGAEAGGGSALDLPFSSVRSRLERLYRSMRDGGGACAGGLEVEVA
jgi:hypothetical protein